MTTHRRHLLLVAAVLAVAACTSAAGPTSAPGASLDPNTSVSAPVPTDSGAGPIVEPSARIVVPKPGQLDVKPIAADTLTAKVDGRRVMVSVAYTSGVEPCYVLDSIIVKTSAMAFEITLREGHGPEDVACIEIAEFKQAIVDLGELDPGTYAISDGQGRAAPISVTVS